MKITILNTVLSFDENELNDDAKMLVNEWLELRAYQQKLFVESQLKALNAIGGILDFANIDVVVTKKRKN